MLSDRGGLMSQGPPSKRQRETEDSDLNKFTVVHDERVWMDDGNIVVTAGEGPTVAFKCHASILASNSDVFKGMLSLPPSNAVETYDDVPKVHLPDSVDDVCALLRMLYDPSLVPYKFRARDTVATIGGPLRLAKKYEMTALYKRLVAVLERDWPSSFHEWECIQRVVKLRLDPDQRKNGTFDYQDENGVSPDPAPVIRLARDIGLQSVLPTAFYELHKWYPPPGEAGHYQTLAIQDDCLSREDLVCFFFGKEKLDMEVKSALSRLKLDSSFWTFKLVTDSTSHETCAAHAVAWWNIVERDILQKYYSAPKDPIQALRTAELELVGGIRVTYERDTELASVCGRCRQFVAGTIAEQWKKIWESLPQIFGVEDAWKEKSDT